LAPNSPSFEVPTPVTWLDTVDRLLSSMKMEAARRCCLAHAAVQA
jgi:hypothetical protein